MQRLRHLIVIVPGIGGSVLSGPDGAQWATTAAAFAGRLIRPGRLDLYRAPELQPTGLIDTFTAFGGLWHLPGYDGLESHLRRTFRDPVVHVHRHGVPVPRNTDVMMFPYDFRRSVRAAAEQLAAAVTDALAGTHHSARRRRVIVVAHSMGGLVARYWLGPLGGAPLCAALLTLGTPHRGAPKALDWLVNGAGAGRLRVPWITRVLRGWPSVYELLPQYPAVWDAAGEHELEFTHLPPHLIERRPRLARYAPTFATMAADARRTHEDIAAAWAELPPDDNPVIPYFGRGHATPNRAELTRSGKLTISKTDPSWRGNIGWRGDGTVPAISAIPRELGENRPVWRGVTDRHTEFASTATVLDLLISYNGDVLPTRGNERPERAWLGLDVEDVVASGDPVRVGVTVQPEGVQAEGIHLMVTDVAKPSVQVYAEPLVADGTNWRGVLPPLAPGRYRLAFEAQRVGGPESVYARCDLLVVDADAVAEGFTDPTDTGADDVEVEVDDRAGAET